MSDNMNLWNAVEKTNPKHTKKANVRGNSITAIAPQSQIKCATEQWGAYGTAWGWSSFEFDYALLATTGIVIFKGLFYYPGGAFPISTSISAYKDGARTKPDADFAKKVETDALTKALSKLGFNADVFMGLYDDNKYVQDMEQEFNKPPVINENQMAALRSLFHSGMSEQQFLQQWNIPKMQDIQQSSYDQVSAWLIESKNITITTTE
jgi:hypothetical protein